MSAKAAISRRRPASTGRMQTTALHVVGGRLVGPTLADPGMEVMVRQAATRLFPSRAATIEHFRKQGVLTRSGKLTKAYGG